MEKDEKKAIVEKTGWVNSKQNNYFKFHSSYKFFLVKF